MELETPDIESLFTKAGHPRKQLAEGVRQIEAWRYWLGENLGIARQPRNNGGVGLVDVYPAPGIVIIGRAHNRNDEDRGGRLRAFEHNRNVEVWSYDRLIREAEKRAASLASDGPSNCEECGEV